MFLRFLFFISIFTGSVAHADVWRATSTWDDSQEIKYSKWIEQSFGESFFTEGDWAGLKTDCADAIYAARIVFSYLNGLPFSLGRTEPRFSSETKEFDQIQDPLQRVRLFIESVNDKTWTGSLAKHTYPISVNRDSVVPGTIWLKPGHVETVTRLRDTGVVELRGSWLPSAIRNMITITTLGHIPSDLNSGFRRWVWPQDFAKPRTSLPGYDGSQVVLPASNVGAKNALQKYSEIALYEESVRIKLARSGWAESSGLRVERLARDFCSLLHARSEVVGLGYGYVEKAARCLNEKEFYAYSTPGRDSNLRRVVYGLGLELQNDLNRVADAVARCEPINLNATTNVQPMYFLRKLLTLDFSSDPHQSPAVRFGVGSSEKVCAGHDGVDSDGS